MARIQHVKHARQRYAQIPALDTEGNQRMAGKRRLTVNDTTRPLAMPKCSACGEPIEPGKSYSFVEPRNSSPIYRHPHCPSIKVWEYSSSLAARVAQIQHEGDNTISMATTLEELTEARDNLAAEITELAEEKRQSAENMEEGFGHATYQSDELNEVAEQLEEWAQEVEGVDIPDAEEPDETCPECGGSGEIEVDIEQEDGTNISKSGDCEDCEGTGVVEPDEDDTDITEHQEALQEALSNCPL